MGKFIRGEYLNTELRKENDRLRAALAKAEAGLRERDDYRRALQEIAIIAIMATRNTKTSLAPQGFDGPYTGAFRDEENAMSSHTPGPWRVDLTVENSTCVIRPIQYGLPLIDVVGLEDARLIAAAPEMLEALKLCAKVIPNLEVHNWPPGWDLKKQALAAARAAIAKAEGK